MKSILSSFISAAMIISEMHHDHLTNDNLMGNPCIPTKKKKGTLVILATKSSILIHFSSTFLLILYFENLYFFYEQ